MCGVYHLIGGGALEVTGGELPRRRLRDPLGRLCLLSRGGQPRLQSLAPCPVLGCQRGFS
eukprot:1195777-Prorocentrum_minimum.AAC.3